MKTKAKRGPGNPGKPPADRLSELVGVRLTPGEYSEAKAAAEGIESTLGAWIRAQIQRGIKRAKR